MRFDVNALRWIMVLVNASALGLVCWGAFVLFLGERDELSLALPDPARFEVEERAKGTTQSKELADVLRRIYLSKPKAAPVRPVVQEQERLPATAGGPLGAEWEVASVYEANGRGMASLKKVTTTTSSRSPTRRNRGRTTRPQRGRTSSPKASAARRGPVAPTKHVVAGKTFFVGPKEYECTKVDFETREVFYKDGSRLFKLQAPEVKTILTVGGDGVITMVGIPLDDDEAAALGAREEAPRGGIEMPGNNKPNASPAGRPVPRTPAAAGKRRAGPEDIKRLNDSMKNASKAEREAIRKAMRELKNL